VSSNVRSVSGVCCEQLVHVTNTGATWDSVYLCLLGVTVTWIVQTEVMKCQDVIPVSYFHIYLGQFKPFCYKYTLGFHLQRFWYLVYLCDGSKLSTGFLTGCPYIGHFYRSTVTLSGFCIGSVCDCSLSKCD